MNDDPITRRRLLTSLMALPAAAAMASACSGSTTVANPVDSADLPSATTAPSATPVATGAPVPSATAAAAAAPTEAVATAAIVVGWASGGTDLITVDYPESGLFSSANTCQVALSRSTTEGPCYFQSDTGEDISGGFAGLPMQLCLQLIGSDCEPIADHIIEVWHCDTNGHYTGETSTSADADRFRSDRCTEGDVTALQTNAYRGQLTSNSDGRVNFKTTFPGWYSGRTIHIHFAVSDPAGEHRIISQFCWPNEFAAEICTTHPLYASRGEQDTPLGRDRVFPSDAEDFFLSTQRNPDGSLLAYAAIQLDAT